MPRPAWHHDIQAMKAFTEFSWRENLQLLHSKMPQRFPKPLISIAARLDYLLRNDKNGWSAPALASHLQQAMGFPQNAERMRLLALSIKHRITLDGPHKTPTKQYYGDQPIADEMIAELEQCFDPETFTLINHAATEANNG